MGEEEGCPYPLVHRTFLLKRSSNGFRRRGEEGGRGTGPPSSPRFVWHVPVSYTRFAAAVTYAMLQGVTLNCRHSPTGATYSIIESHDIACRVPTMTHFSICLISSYYMPGIWTRSRALPLLPPLLSNDSPLRPLLYLHLRSVAYIDLPSYGNTYCSYLRAAEGQFGGYR